MNKIKLMIVEDDPFILNDLTTITDWEAMGLEIITAANGKQGLHKFEQFLPMIVITDVRMPFMDGLEMMARIRKQNPYIQFLILSAYNDFASVQEALRQGARDYILKQDISSELLRDKVSFLRDVLAEQREFAFNAIQSRLYRLLSSPPDNPEDLRESIGQILHLTGFFPEDQLLLPTEEFVLELMRKNVEEDRLARLQVGSPNFFTSFQQILLAGGHGGVPSLELPKSALVDKAKEYLHLHFREANLSTADIGREIGISYGRLSVIFREQTGTTLSDYITDLRIQEAKRLLCDGELKIYEVAESVGYRSSQYFSYVFRARVGQSPISYRKGE